MTLMDKANLARIGFREWLGGLGRLGKGLLIGALALCVAVPFGIIRGCKAPPPAVTVVPKKVPAVKKRAVVKKAPTPSKARPTPQLKKSEARSPARGVPEVQPRFVPDQRWGS